MFCTLLVILLVMVGAQLCRLSLIDAYAVVLKPVMGK